MYAIYHTEALVLGGHSIGEANKIISLFTSDLGLVYARAQGVRLEASKLRYSLQDFSHVYIDLVRGKSGWRVTSAQSERDFTGLHLETSLAEAKTRRERKEVMGVLGRTSLLLLRLLNGEEKDEELFQNVLTSFSALQEEGLSPESIKNTEILLVMNILHRLGYWGEDKILSPFIAMHTKERLHTFSTFAPLRTRAIEKINESLKESQL